MDLDNASYRRVL